MSYASPRTERPAESGIEALKDFLLVSCAPVLIDSSVYYLPLVDAHEIEFGTHDDLIGTTDETASFLDRVSSYGLTCMSGLTGKKLDAYSGGDVFRLFLDDDTQCVVYDV